MKNIVHCDLKPENVLTANSDFALPQVTLNFGKKNEILATNLAQKSTFLKVLETRNLSQKSKFRRNYDI